jgi:subtilisin family serine protease
MVDKKYIVLQTQPHVVPEAGGIRVLGEPSGEGPTTTRITEVALSEAERSDLRRDPRTRAIAPSMPMKLVEPKETTDAIPQAGPATWGVEAVRAPDSPFDGTGVTVAVLDTGIDPNHPAFRGVQLVRRNFTTESDDDLHGHGTHCAGTIFGRNVNGTRIGVAPGVQRAVIGKVLGQGGGSSSIIAQAIEWALDEGASVVSMSLGIDFPGFVDELVNIEGLNINPATSIALEAYRANVNLFTELARLVQARGAFGNGTIVVAASGNESDRPNFTIAVAPPAAGTGVVAVGALQESPQGLRVAAFSNTQVDVAGPGVSVVSAKRGGGLTSMSGTSMATPHVAGAACLWAQKALQASGRIESGTLMAQLVARANAEVLAPGSQESDVGTGIVQAPLV